MSGHGDRKAPASPPPNGPDPGRGRHVLGSYVTFMAVASALGFVKTLVFAEVLGPQGLGYYGYVLLVLQFGLYASNWGLLNGLNVELPLAYGRQDRRSDRLADATLSALVLTAALTALVYFGIVASIDVADPNVRTALLLAAGTTFLTTLTEFYILVMRARRQLVPLSLTYLMRAVLAITLGAAAGSIWGFEATIVSEIVALAVTVAVAVAVWVPDVRPIRPDLSQAIKLVRVGFPLMVSNLVIAASLATDRIFVAGSLPELFGQYTFATIVVTASLAVASMISQVVSPQLLYERGAGLSLLDVRRRMRRVAALVLAGGLLLLALLVPATTLLGNGPLSEYHTGLELMPILLVGGIAAILGVYGVVLVAARRFVLTMLATGAGLVVALAAGLAVALGSPSLTAFAWVFTASQIVSATAVVIASEIVVRREPGSAARGSGREAPARPDQPE